MTVPESRLAEARALDAERLARAIEMLRGLDWLYIFDKAVGGDGNGTHGQDRFVFNARVKAVLTAVLTREYAEVAAIEAEARAPLDVERLREAVDAALFDAEMDDSHPGCRAKWRRVAMGAFDAATSA